MSSQTAWIAVILGIAVLLVLIQTVRLLRQDKSAPATITPPIDTFDPPARLALNEIELACQDTLNAVAGNACDIRPKLILAEVLPKNIAAEQSDIERPDIEQAVLNSVVDFVLFKQGDQAPFCAIQIQNPANIHQEKQRELLTSSDLPVFQLRRKTSYPIIKIQRLVQPWLSAPSVSPDDMVATISMQAFRECKSCNARMHVQRATAGPHKGMLFWVCSKYPQCRSVELYTR
ncbi:MAG: hypothetical protein ACE5E3_03085 [Mariprofundus sp.]